MKRIRVGLIAVGMLALSACGGWQMPDPCAGSFTPTEKDLEAAANGYEVEDDRTSCELTRDGVWVYDD